VNIDQKLRFMQGEPHSLPMRGLCRCSSAGAAPGMCCVPQDFTHCELVSLLTGLHYCSARHRPVGP
jgi:hypothetical protein